MCCKRSDFYIQNWFMRIWKQYTDMNYKKMMAFGLHPGQLHVLKVTGENEGISQKEIAGMLHIKPPTVAVTMKRMEKSGLIYRVENESDLRVSRVYLSDKGKEIFGKTETAVRENEKIILQGFSEEDLVQLDSFFERMLENMHRVSDETALEHDTVL